MLQIGGKGLADIGRQRQLGPPSALTPNCDLAEFPIDIFKLQADDFGSADSKSGEQYQNGVIASSSWSAPVGEPEDFLNAASWQKFRNC